MKVFEILQEDELSEIATVLLPSVQQYNIVLFTGNLGAGKTTFIKHLCYALGAKDDFSSPTFSIINHYSCTKGTIYHMDLYRLQDVSELFDLGFEEYIDSGNICFIEWPEIAGPFLSQVPCLSIHINYSAETHTRTITIKEHAKGFIVNSNN